MSTSPEQNQEKVDIDDDVEVVTEQIAALQELAQQHDLPDDKIYDFSIRWGTALAGRLRRMVHYSSLGMLDRPDEDRFQALCEELRSLSSLIDRFGLAHPVFTDPPERKRRAIPLLRPLRRR